MKYTLGIDLGTSYFKFGIYDQKTNLKGLGRVAVEKDVDNQELCELPVERFQSLLKQGFSLACQESQIQPSEITSIGYSSQGSSFLLLDKNYNPLTPIILWLDKRFPQIHTKVQQVLNQPDFLQITGMGIEYGALLSINKLAWIQSCQPELWNKVKKVMTISDYLNYLFTGEEVSDLGTASLLGLVDCKNSKWWSKAFEILDLDESTFSKCSKIGTKIEKTDTEFSKKLGLKKDVSYHLGSLDHHMAALGAGIKETTDMSISIGTVLACVNITEHYNPTKNVFVVPWQDGKYCQLTYDNNGATSLEWYQKNFASQYTIKELNELAKKVQSSHGLIAKPNAFRYNKLVDVFENIDNSHQHGHFVYALMESSAKTFVDLIDDLCPIEKPKQLFATGGGSKSDIWLKIISEITGCSVTAGKNIEPATAGAVIV